MVIKFLSALLLSTTIYVVAHPEHRQCIILLDDTENIGKLEKFSLIAILQTAIAEQAAPILLNASLLNLFVERRLMIEQNLQIPNSRQRKVCDFFQKIDERFAYWSNYYNDQSTDVPRNKELVIRKINKEFYLVEDKINFSMAEYQLLLDYTVIFNLTDWNIYTNAEGYYLLVPKTYSDRFQDLGLKLDTLQIINSLDTGVLFFESQKKYSPAQVLHDFFITCDDVEAVQYCWSIVLFGHGGIFCKESNENDNISWTAGASIANMSVQEFKETLAFFNTYVRMHSLYYISCYAGGNHSKIIFNSNDTYNFPIICGTLTDCAYSLVLSMPVPSASKKMLETHEVLFDKKTNSWKLDLKNRLKWNDFFKNIIHVDFSIGSIERLQEVLFPIKKNLLRNIPLLCLPGTYNFFPLSGSNMIKIDNVLQDAAEDVGPEKGISIYGREFLLIESSYVQPTISLENSLKYRFISISPGNAIHYFKRIKSVNYLDLPSTFWQVDTQLFDKTFLIDECIFPFVKDARMFKDISVSGDRLTLKNVLIMQYASNYIRLFFTIEDTAFMVLAHKPDQGQDKATIQAVIKLSPKARACYDAYYESLRLSFQTEDLKNDVIVH